MNQLLLVLTICATLAACSESEFVSAPTEFVQGAAIDGSEDVREPAPVAAGAHASAATRDDGEASEAEQLTNRSAPDDAGRVADDAAQVAPTPAESAPLAASAAQPEVNAPLAPAEANEPKGPLHLTYKDLSLIEYDVDAMLDYMLFPDEYKDEDTSFLELPKDLKALDGKEVSLVGYMIPGKIEKGDVRDFMLVRDLMGCCFGGTPMPDEWVDVVMDEGAKAEYRPYMPMRVQGILTLGGEQDEAGFALGIYRLKASAVQVED